MTNELGTLINTECTRAEKDFEAFRARGAAVLTASGGLVTLLAALLAIAVGKDAHLNLGDWTKGAAVVGLVAFVLAAACVLRMYLPISVNAPKADDLLKFVGENWDDDGWEKSVAEVSAKYLKGMRGANKTLGKWLLFAIIAEVAGIAAVAFMAIALVT